MLRRAELIHDTRALPCTYKGETTIIPEVMRTSALPAVKSSWTVFGSEPCPYPDAPLYTKALAEAETCRMSAANFVEAAIVVETQTRHAGASQFDAFFRRAGITIESVTEEHAHAARQAYTDFGKGRHPAGLNYGDCFSYALAKITGEPLLYKGNDFKKTDIAAAL